jgi:hypothetical protein
MITRVAMPLLLLPLLMLGLPLLLAWAWTREALSEREPGTGAEPYGRRRSLDQK